jgi:hypothetical protein
MIELLIPINRSPEKEKSNVLENPKSKIEK